MKLICDACKLTLNARDEDRGKPFQCPICHAALRDADSAKANGSEARPAGALDWSGGTVDDLIYMINSQALAAVIEAHAPDKKGEVHLIAGGIDEAYAGELRGDDALEVMRKLPSPRFRVEMRLPNEDSGSLAAPGPDKGDLKTRPLAQLMRYCESFVLTCDLEVWRANETCRVEYRQGNIARSLVNGVDAPEQIGDVMGWSAGNYRFVLPRLALPQVDDTTRAQAKAAAETKISDQKAARKTMFGMPAPVAAMAQAGAGGAALGGAGGGAASAPPPQAVMMSPPATEPAPASRPVAANATMIGMPSMLPQAGKSSAPASAPKTQGPPSVVVEEAYPAPKAKTAEPAKPAAAPSGLPPSAKPSQPASAKAPQPAHKPSAKVIRPAEDDEPMAAPPTSKLRTVQYAALAVGVGAIGWLLVRLLLS